MNVQSIKNKFDNIQGFILRNKCDILALTETWLDKTELFLYEIDNYNSFHSCRNSRGGGSSIYIHNSIKCEVLDQSKENDIINWVCVKIGSDNLIISVLYRPPSYNVINFFDDFENLLMTYKTRHVIVGDFNINLLEGGTGNNAVANYKKLLVYNNFVIINNLNPEYATRCTSHSRSIIDHVITDARTNPNINNFEVNLNPLSDHHSLSFNIHENIKTFKPKVNHQVVIVDHKKFINIFKERISESVDFSSFTELTDLIVYCKKTSEVTKKFKIRQGNIWINQEILDLMKQRDLAYKEKVKNAGVQYFNQNYKSIKNRLNNKIRYAKNKFFQDKWEKTGHDHKKQWRFINDFFKPKVTENHIDVLSVNGRQIYDKYEIVNSLNNHFAYIGENIVKDLNNEINQSGDHTEVLFEEISSDAELNDMNLTNEVEINKIILELKPNSAPGDDNVTVRDLLNLKESVVKPIAKLANNMILSGTFPAELKRNKITPIFKSGDKGSMHNYRPITVISVFSKILEKIIKARITTFLDNYVPMDPYQYGFIKNSGTLAATFDFINYISKALDEKFFVIAVFVDLKKAFDVVSIDRLLEKIKSIGLKGTLHSLLKSYLYNRQQYVKQGEVISGLLTNPYGVPQGSVLGPLLYSLYVLSLQAANLQGKYFTFADDTALIYTGRNEVGLQTLVNEDLDTYLKWLYCNRLKINIDKTKYLLFKQKNTNFNNVEIRINNITLEKVSSIKYLGLIVDENLNWHQHISKICNKITPMFSVLFKCRHYLNNKTKYLIYNSFFLSHLRYLIPVWGTCCQTAFKDIQVLQNKILKILFNYNKLTSTVTLYSELRVAMANKILELEQCKLVYKIIHNTQKNNLSFSFTRDVHNHFTRSLNNIYPINSRTNFALNCPMQSASKSYNKLPDNIKSAQSYNIFVNKLKQHLNVP